MLQFEGKLLDGATGCAGLRNFLDDWKPAGPVVSALVQQRKHISRVDFEVDEHKWHEMGQTLLLFCYVC